MLIRGFYHVLRKAVTLFTIKLVPCSIVYWLFIEHFLKLAWRLVKGGLSATGVMLRLGREGLELGWEGNDFFLLCIVAIIFLACCCSPSCVGNFNFFQRCYCCCCWGQSLHHSCSFPVLPCSVLSGGKVRRGLRGSRGAGCIWGRARVQRFFQWVSQRRGGCLRLQVGSGQLFKLGSSVLLLNL